MTDLQIVLIMLACALGLTGYIAVCDRIAR